jgi:hypothetical protein
MVENGLLERRDGRLRPISDASLAGHIPEGLRGVVARRLALLGASTKQT